MSIMTIMPTTLHADMSLLQQPLCQIVHEIFLVCSVMVA